MDTPATTKMCTKCGEEKSREEFSRDKSRKDGLQRQCKHCYGMYRLRNLERITTRKREHRGGNRDSILEQKRRHYAANRERLVEQKRQWRRENPDYQGQWRSRNRDQVAIYNRQWHEAHRGERADYGRSRRQADPAYFRLSNARRRALKRAATVQPFTAADLTAYYEARGLDACVYCGGPHEHDDHVIPLARGGHHAIWNLVPACAACNCSKGAKDVLDWLGDREVPEAVRDALGAAAAHADEDKEIA